MVNLIDISGIVNSIKHAIGKWLNKKPENITLKPFDCSYCSSWWAGLIYLIYVGEINLMNIAILLLICACTPVIADMIWAIKDLFGVIPTLLNKLNNKMYK